MLIWKRFREWRHFEPALYIGALSLVVVSALLVARYAPDAHNAYQGSERKIPAIVEKTADDRIADYTGWLTLFTGLLAIATLGLIRATHRLGDRADKGMRELERAYLFFGPAIKPGVLIRPPHAEVQIVAFNMGKTPAFIKEVYLDIIDLKPLPNTPTYEGGDLSVTDAVVASDKEQGLAGKVFFGMEEALFIGYVKYDDIFGKSHITRACVKVHGRLLFEDPPKIFTQPYGHPDWNKWD